MEGSKYFGNLCFSKIDLFEQLKDLEFMSSFIKELIEDGSDVDTIKLFVETVNNLDEDYNWDVPRKVLIPKGDIGKFREVFIFSEKDSLLLKAINFLFNLKLGHLVSTKVYSYKKGVNVFSAAKEVMSSISYSSINYVKADISKYFNSVNLGTISKTIEDLVIDVPGRNLLHNLYSINKFMDCDGIVREEYLGLMPGTALSSFMSNYILHEVDRVLNEYVDFYIRYSDDVILIDKDKWKLNTALGILNSSIKSFGLELNIDKVSVNINATSVEFLGLKITRDFIDISDKNFNKIKSNIKSICKRIRRKYELDYKHGYNVAIEDYLKMSIRMVNKYLYGSHIKGPSLNKNSTLTYLFRNITSEVTLKELDFYLCDTLRYVCTGRYNKANSIKVSTEYLETLGFVSSVKLYNLGKVSSSYLSCKINSMITKPFSFRKFPVFYNPNGFDNKEIEDISFLGFINSCIRNKFELYINGKVYDINDLCVDFIDKVIYIDNHLLVDGDSYVFSEEFGAYSDSVFYRFNSNGLLYQTLATEKDLSLMYLNTYLDCYDVLDKTGHNPYNYFMKVNKNDFYFNNNSLNLELSSPLMFAINFYCTLYSLNKVKKELEFVTIGSIVFESKLIP